MENYFCDITEKFDQKISYSRSEIANNNTVISTDSCARNESHAGKLRDVDEKNGPGSRIGLQGDSCTSPE